MLIQGKYEEASYCNCLQEERRILASDGRFPLYKVCNSIFSQENKQIISAAVQLET